MTSYSNNNTNYNDTMFNIFIEYKFFTILNNYSFTLIDDTAYHEKFDITKLSLDNINDTINVYLKNTNIRVTYFALSFNPCEVATNCLIDFLDLLSREKKINEFLSEV